MATVLSVMVQPADVYTVIKAPSRLFAMMATPGNWEPARERARRELLSQWALGTITMFACLGIMWWRVLSPPHRYSTRVVVNLLSILALPVWCAITGFMILLFLGEYTMGW